MQGSTVQTGRLSLTLELGGRYMLPQLQCVGLLEP